MLPHSIDLSEHLSPMARKQRVRLLRKLGNEYFEQNNYGGALIRYTEAIQQAPDEIAAGIYCNRAAVLIKLDSLKEAEADLKKSLELQPDYVPSLCRLAFLKLFQGDPISSIKNYVRAVTVCGDTTNTLPRFRAHLKDAVKMATSRAKQQGYSPSYIKGLIPAEVQAKLDSFASLSDLDQGTTSTINRSRTEDERETPHREDIHGQRFQPGRPFALNVDNAFNQPNGPRVVQGPNGFSASFTVGQNQANGLMDLISHITGQANDDRETTENDGGIREVHESTGSVGSGSISNANNGASSDHSTGNTANTPSNASSTSNVNVNTNATSTSSNATNASNNDTNRPNSDTHSTAHEDPAEPDVDISDVEADNRQNTNPNSHQSNNNPPGINLAQTAGQAAQSFIQGRLNNQQPINGVDFARGLATTIASQIGHAMSNQPPPDTNTVSGQLRGIAQAATNAFVGASNINQAGRATNSGSSNTNATPASNTVHNSNTADADVSDLASAADMDLD